LAEEATSTVEFAATSVHNGECCQAAGFMGVGRAASSWHHGAVLERCCHPRRWILSEREKRKPSMGLPADLRSLRCLGFDVKCNSRERVASVKGSTRRRQGCFRGGADCLFPDARLAMLPSTNCCRLCTQVVRQFVCGDCIATRDVHMRSAILRGSALQ